ncbi:hypothetical protein MLD38_004868 [Melastoma candidum]|uniref:Uncharacterized protein n=1 Tax=Melastoma candidum TaxID=119954 RepID=A0ACB9S771_9MYRT|nr:hypothetical protein MLD38_004868 [Melastoma candidum]
MSAAVGGVVAPSLLQLLILLPEIAPEVVCNASMELHVASFCHRSVFAHILTIAGSATSGVPNANQMGIDGQSTSELLHAIQGFCDHTTISLAFPFLGCISLAASAVWT